MTLELILFVIVAVGLIMGGIVHSCMGPLPPPDFPEREQLP